jgi:hypothetical protein
MSATVQNKNPFDSGAMESENRFYRAPLRHNTATPVFR